MTHLDHLVAALPDGVVVMQADAMEKYLGFDWSRDQSAGVPVAVVRAEDAGQVQTAVRWAAANDVGIVPRGAGSGLSGGSTAVDGCLVISLERTRRVEIDTATQVAIAEPGAFNADVKRAAAEHGRETARPVVVRDLLDRLQRGDDNAGGRCASSTASRPTTPRAPRRSGGRRASSRSAANRKDVAGHTTCSSSSSAARARSAS